jgi:hypothetical protein
MGMTTGSFALKFKIFLLQNTEVRSGQKIQILQNNLFQKFGFYREVGHISFPPFFPFLQTFPQLLVTSPPEMEFLNSKVSGHKLEYCQTRVFVWFSTLIFPIYKMLFINSLDFSLADFFVFLKPE